jgi:hypothetical protein
MNCLRLQPEDGILESGFSLILKNSAEAGSFYDRTSG